MYARVIVDVPAQQVNRPFDYEIPYALTADIQVGMRVTVPFGGRQVQGFVVGLSAESEFEGDVKEIESVMDFSPVLSTELLALGEYLARHVFAFLVQCYQTMLPTMLKTTVEKYAILNHPDKEEEIFSRVFHYESEKLITSEMPASELAEMMRLHRQGIVSFRTKVQDRLKVKTQEWLVLTYLPEEYREIELTLSKRAYRKRAFVKTLATLGMTTIAKKDFLKRGDFTQSDVRFAVKAGWVRIEKQTVARDPFESKVFEPTRALVLNEEQQQVFDTVVKTMKTEESQVFLLQGVTGSGKTEVYMQWIGKAIEQGKTAMMLVPEIALTPQMVTRFKSRFGDRVAVLHSGLNAGEKYDEWLKIKERRADIVVGARSSVFAPLENIGMIILDEEHEGSYKQDDSPRYHARDVAIWRGNYHHCPVVLGSATPSLESRARAQKGVYTLLRLDHRAKKQSLPKVHLVDMRQEFGHTKGDFSNVLLTALEDRLEKGEQSVLLLNRRGYSSFIMCRDCGYVVECPNCDISLTLHMDTKRMKCHYCGHEEGIPNHCPKCHSREIRYYGTGTQKVQEQLSQLLPQARVIRMDVDTTRRKGQHEALLKEFELHQADILIGTQMIAKGLDYPNVTLVGVINADTALNIPDFRAAEKTFQLLTQVAGRAGRGEKAGEVYIQTYNPDHYAIQLAKGHYYDQFFAQEMKMRHLAHYPPYYFTVMITISSEQEHLAEKQAWEVRRFLESSLSDTAILLGPSVKSIARMNNRYYYQVILKYKKEVNLEEKLQELLEKTQTFDRKRLVTIDVEPQFFL